MDQKMSFGFDMIMARMDMFQDEKLFNTSQEIKSEASKEDDLDSIPPETPPPRTILPPRKARDAFLPPPIAPLDTLGNSFSTPTAYPNIPRSQYQHANFRHAEQLHAKRDAPPTTSYFQ
jgi:hypothetical protein